MAYVSEHYEDVKHIVTFFPASIRAYGAQELFSSRLKSRINTLSRASCTFFDVNRWIAVRIDTLSGIFAASVSVYLVYGGKVSAGAAGFTISMVLGFSRQMIWWVRMYNMLEIQGRYLCPPLIWTLR